MDEQIVGLGAQLADLMARNTATFVFDRIRASRATDDKDQVIAELQQIVQDLIADKNEAVQIAQAFEGELVAKRITDEEITYVTSTVTQLVGRIAELSEDGASPLPPESQELISDFLRPETLTVLQTLGFDFRAAIGQPLTEVVRSHVRRAAHHDVADQYELMRAMNEAEMLRHKTAQSPAASDRYMQLTADPLGGQVNEGNATTGQSAQGSSKGQRQQPKRRSGGRH